MLAWHFLNDEGTLCKGNLKVEVGQTLRMRGPIIPCDRGFHASVRPLDALRYAPGAVVQRVRLTGEIVEQADKVVASERTCLWIADATRTLHEFAIWCGEQALREAQARRMAVDARSWHALEAKRQWLDGNVSDVDLATARAAAYAAAAAAAYAYAYAAADAYAAAAQNQQLETMLFHLAPVGYREGS